MARDTSRSDDLVTIELSALQRMTAVVPDASAAASYLCDLLGAVPLDAAGTSEGTDGATLHRVGLGDVVLEFVAPKTSRGYWADRLAAHGPSVLSLGYLTSDPEAAAAALVAEGIDRYPGPRVELDTTGIIGFDLEFSAGDPATPAPPVRGDTSPLMQIEITHDDIASAQAWLGRWFGSERVELEFAARLEAIVAGRMRIEHVNLANAMLQYVQPRNDAGPWWDQLQQRGRSVHNLTWFPDDMAAVAVASSRAGTSDLRYFEFDYGPIFGVEHLLQSPTVGRIIDARSILGFHVELSEVMASNVNDYLFKKTGVPRVRPAFSG